MQTFRNIPFATMVLLLALTILFAGIPQQTFGQRSKADMSNLQRNVANMHKRLTVLEQRVEKLSMRIDEQEKIQRQNRADQSVANDDIRTEMRTIKGSMDVVAHQMRETTRKSDRIKEDFDARLSEIEENIFNIRRTKSSAPDKATKFPTQSTSPASSYKMSDVDDITRYNQILRVILDDKNYAKAVGQFRQFIGNHPNSSLADNAQYWMGEGYFAKGDYARSISEFQKVLEKYPTSEKACDAVLKQGFAFDKMNEKGKARLFLVETQKKCPGTKTASRASERLKQLESGPTIE